MTFARMSAPKASSDVQPLVENLFRRESGKLTSALTRFFGTKHLELAEDVVQETLIKAMHEWPFKGIPDNPVAWLHRVARNGVIDRLRRDVRGLELLKENATLLRSEWTLSATVNQELNEEAVADDQLRMLFACCHPTLPPEQQVALALKTLCGFSVSEIARAFVTNEETINKRLYRAREAFRELGRLEIPSTQALPARLEHVLSTIYLLFNEGYNSSSHNDLIREDLIEEALRLCHMLTQLAVTDQPRVHALLALMLFHTSRSAARLDADGAIVLLPDQDRTLWDRPLITLGNWHLNRAAEGQHFTEQHIEAAIAALHANANDHACTDWNGIVGLYDQLLRMKPSSIVAFNRAIAVAEAQGAPAGLAALRSVDDLGGNHLYHAALGDLLQRSGDRIGAKNAFVQALALVCSPAETALLRKKLRAVEN
jgi:RNA polymerase sigma factor (sigma-70 family)